MPKVNFLDPNSNVRSDEHADNRVWEADVVTLAAQIGMMCDRHLTRLAQQD